MSRRRYISTDISTDTKLAELSDHGLLPLVLYTWSIPHMDDWGRITGDPRQFKLLVCPALDVSSKDVDQALELIATAGLWTRYEVDGKKCIFVPDEKWFKHQSYINKSKRTDDSGSNYPRPPTNTNEHRESPQITEEEQGTPNNTASFSLSSSLSSSLSVSPLYSTTTTDESEITVMDAYEIAFGGLNMTGLISGYIAEIRQKGCDDSFIKELLLETGESSTKPNLKLLRAIGDRWIEQGIRSREQSKEEKKKRALMNGGGRSGTSSYSNQPKKPHIEMSKEPENLELPSDEEFQKAMEYARKIKEAKQKPRPA